MSENLPDEKLLIVAPRVSAESSIISKLCFFAILYIRGQLGRLPNKLGTEIAFVFLLIALSI